MNEIITEKNYPVHWLWVLKPTTFSVSALIILISMFLGSNHQGGIAEIIVYIALLGFFIIINLILVSSERENFHYSIGENFLTVEQGIFSKERRYIPYGVIQNIFIEQDLFDRIFGLATVIIENASQGSEDLATLQQRKRFATIGFFGNKVIIPGLTKANAETLKGIILQKIKENPIEDNQSGL